MDGDDVEARLEAVERALADGEADLTEITEAAEHARELDELRDRIDDLESEVTDLAASVQAVRGYVGNVRTVNQDVERRADAALAKVEELERRGTDREGRHSPEQSESADRTDGRGTDRTESPGDIARRITGRDEPERGRRSPRTGGGGRDGGGHRHADGNRRTRPRSRDRSGPTTGSKRNDDEDGFLSGLRDAL